MITASSRRSNPHDSALARIANWTKRKLGIPRASPERETGESRYRRLFDRLPMALYLSAPDGSILDVNPAMVELLGYPSRDSLLQLNAFDIFAEPEVRENQVNLIEEEDLVRGYEMQLRRFDGKLIWVLDHARAVRDSAGEVMFYEGALEDITERKLAQEELQRTNEKLRAVIENSPLAIISQDLHGNIASWNAAAERIFGWREDEIKGQPLPALVPEEEREQFWKLLERLGRGERLEEIEVRRRRRDGTVIDVSLSAGPLRAPDGSIVGTIGVVADITERKRTEETRRRLVEILEATPDLVGVSTIDGTGIYLNPAGRKMLGLGPEATQSEARIWEYHPDADAKKMRDQVIPTAVRDGTWTGEITFKSRDGREVPTSLVMISHRTPDGEVDHFSTMARDLTEQKRLEERLRQAQTMDAIGRLAGGIAHDFNNLLTAIIGNADLLLHSLDDRQARADVDQIKQAGQRAAALTSQLLAFSRRKVMQLHPLDLNEVIADLGSRFKEMLGEDIDLVTVLDGTLGLVKADSIQLEEVVASLAENACEAMPDGGRLTIETTQITLTADESFALGLPEPGRYAVLSITDTGIGMDEETRTRIFEPFFSTKTEVKGTGLGLPTVYGMLKQGGGGILVESEPGVGTTVKVYLPAIERPDAGEPADSTSTSQQPGAETILVVEDEPAVLSLACRVLRDRGYRVLEARDGLEALHTLEEHPGTLDMLITDIVMPRLGGPELAAELLKSHPETQIVYMSGYHDNEIVREMMADQNTPFLQKPFTPSTLLEAARRALGERPDATIEHP